MSDNKDKVRFMGSTIEQVNWGGNDNPDGLLTVGDVYTVKECEVHSWHTKLHLTEFPDKVFNSVSFEDVDACSRLPNAPAPQPTEWPHPMTPRTVVPESADKTPRPYHGPVKPEPEESPELAQAVEQRDQEKCGKCVIHFIAREGSFYPCDLPEGHEGGHRASGNCFKHGYYLGEVDSVPHCPQCPELIGEWHSTTAPSQPELLELPDEITLPRYVMWAQLVRLQRQLAQIESAKIPTIGYVWVHGVQMQGEITAVPRWMALEPDVKKALASATQTIAALRLEVELGRKKYAAFRDEMAADNARLQENCDALNVDNAQLEHDVAEWSTIANLGNDRIAAAKAVGVVFADPGTTCVNQRAEDAEAKVRGLYAKFMCQSELDKARVVELEGGK